MKNKDGFTYNFSFPDISSSDDKAYAERVFAQIKGRMQSKFQHTPQNHSGLTKEQLVAMEKGDEETRKRIAEGAKRIESMTEEELEDSFRAKAGLSPKSRK